VNGARPPVGVAVANLDVIVSLVELDPLGSDGVIVSPV
jgi:hypothetical protein